MVSCTRVSHDEAMQIAGETARRREETNSEGRTMSSPEAAESEEIPHLKDPTEEDRGGTDSIETREHDGKYAVTDPLGL